VLSRLPPALRDEVVSAFFDPAKGLGYALARTHLNSCDFSLGNYAHADTPGDFELKHFDLARAEKHLFPLMTRARDAAGGNLGFVISPWSPSPWMKTTGRMNGGGKLRPECRDAWAACYVRFIEACRARGLEIWGLTVQNEPNATQRWDSCDYTAEEERDFVRDHLGPALHRANLADVRVIVWDHNRDLLLHRSSVIFADPEASRYIWGAGFHWYDDPRFDNVRQHHETWPDKHLIFTEGCQEGGTHLGSWALGERYATSILRDLNNWTEAWLDWNIVLDETGGPNHVGNMCSAPIIADTKAGRLLYQNSYHYIGHFSRFIRPGAKRILCATTKDRLEATAFANPDGTIAVVALNTSDEPIPFDLYLGEREASLCVPAHGIVTWVIAPEA
jgi:glucosylceramidase